MRRIAWTVAVVCLLLVGVRTEKGEVAGAGQLREGSDLHLSFGGLICHVFDPAHAPRAVILRGTSSMPHHATLTMPEEQIASTEVPLDCAQGQCAIDLANTAVRFQQAGRADYERNGSFDLIVPHLKAVTNGAMYALRDDVFDEVPSPDSPMSAYFELPAGTMTTVPYPQLSRYDPDYENRGLRQFPNGVFLTGHIARPVLLVRRPGDERWKRITFRPDSLIDIHVSNEPTAGGGAMHATIYYLLSKVPLDNAPVIASGTGHGGVSALDTVAGCSNSTFP